MANIMSSMKIPIQKLVSKKKKRYTEDGFNLDLAYILPNLIAMGFPANKIEGVYRNHIDEVYRFLEMKHGGVYKIYNLCSERRYDSNKFHSRVARYPFHDHNPPNIEQIQAFCDDVHQWLNANPEHIAAVHCKAGKGRTGTMICCYMLHNRHFMCAKEALLHYGEQRTHDQKGVTIPSQRRYVEYYSYLLKSGQPYARVPLQICEMRLSSPPMLNNHQGSFHFSISCVVSDTNEYPIYTSEVPDVKKSNSAGNLVIGLDQCIALAGDIKVEFFNKRMARKNSVLFRFWFNTYFVNELHKDKNESCNPYLEYALTKNEIDNAHKDTHNKIYPPDFKVFVKLQRTPAGPYVRGGPEQDIHQLQCQAAAVAAAAAAASTDHHHNHHPLQQHNHHPQQPSQPFSNPHHNHHYSNSNHHHHPVVAAPLHPHLQSTLPTTTSLFPSSMVAPIGASTGGRPQLLQENHLYHHNNSHHLNTHPNHHSHNHHTQPTPPLLQQQQTNRCDLSLGEGGTDEECGHHPTPSDSPEASSSGGSSTGEDWESDTHKSHPTDTNSTTSTITTSTTSTTTTNNNNSPNTTTTSNNNNNNHHLHHHSSSASTTIADSGGDVDYRIEPIADEYDEVFEPKSPNCRSASANNTRGPDGGVAGGPSSVYSTPASSPRHSSPNSNPLAKSYSAANSFFRSKRRLSIFPPTGTAVTPAAGGGGGGAEPAIAVSSPTSPTLPGISGGTMAEAQPSLTHRPEGGMFAIFTRHFVRRKST